MQKFMRLPLTVGAGAFALGWIGLHAAIAADMPYPQGQYEGPPPTAYSPPPAEENYGYPPPPAVAYGYPSPPPVAYGYPTPAPYYEYGPPPYVAVPEPYYALGPYWRGYRPHYAYAYGRWGRGYRRW